MGRNLSRRSKADLKILGVVLLFLFRNKLVALLALALAGIWYSYEVFYARPQATFGGVPQEQHWDLNHFTRVFRNNAFMLGYSEWRGSPLWVTYQLTTKPENVKNGKRPSGFYVDQRSIRRVRHDDYTGSGYDRGHMAPNYAIATLYGRKAQIDTFDMTNITPQKPKLNRKLWQRLESVEIDYLAKWFQSIWVFTGPIYGEDKKTLKSSKVEIPEAFYKIYIQPKDENGKVHALALIMPQNVYGNESLLKYVTTVDEVEQRTGLDFFPALEDKIEQQIESQNEVDYWRLEEVAKLPSRF